ncbi:MAG TPA: hypothetical protein VGH28_21615 [Polyangiaceae bacterium]
MSADDYEKKYMSGEGALASSRARMPWFFDVLLLILAGITTATSIASGTWVALATVPLLLLVWILFMFLRVTVTPDALHVQLGVFGPHVAMSTITSASVAKYDSLKYGGWGIRLGLDGSVAYSLPGHGGKGVAVTFEKNGKPRKMFVTCPNPEEIVAAIEKARGGARVAEEVRVAQREGVEAETSEPEERAERTEAEK